MSKEEMNKEVIELNEKQLEHVSGGIAEPGITVEPAKPEKMKTEKTKPETSKPLKIG